MATSSTVTAGPVDLAVLRDGDPEAPVLLLLGVSAAEWDDDLVARLAAHHHVVRYDLRDVGHSTTVDPTAPAYDLRDLVADAAAVAAAHSAGPVHVLGRSVGGWIAQLLALDHPERVATLTLVSTRAVAPGPVDDDLPDHDPAIMEHFGTAGEPAGTDRHGVVEHALDAARVMAGRGPFDEAAARTGLERRYDRVASAPPEVATVPLAVRLAATLGGVTFARIDCAPRWRERLGAIAAPTLVVHGEDDPFFPVGNGHALAAAIPGARLLLLPGTGHELPPRDVPTAAAAVLDRTGVTRG